jgi:hypothetical protein
MLPTMLTFVLIQIVAERINSVLAMLDANNPNAAFQADIQQHIQMVEALILRGHLHAVIIRMVAELVGYLGRWSAITSVRNNKFMRVVLNHLNFV